MHKVIFHILCTLFKVIKGQNAIPAEKKAKKIKDMVLEFPLTFISSHGPNLDIVVLFIIIHFFC